MKAKGCEGSNLNTGNSGDIETYTDTENLKENYEKSKSYVKKLVSENTSLRQLLGKYVEVQQGSQNNFTKTYLKQDHGFIAGPFFFNLANQIFC